TRSDGESLPGILHRSSASWSLSFTLLSDRHRLLSSRENVADSRSDADQLVLARVVVVDLLGGEDDVVAVSGDTHLTARGGGQRSPDLGDVRTRRNDDVVELSGFGDEAEGPLARRIRVFDATTCQVVVLDDVDVADGRRAR